MIYGIFLDPRSWKIDVTSHSGWNPEKYGVSVSLYNERSQLNKAPIDSKCSFAISTEAWTPQMQETLEYLKNKHNLKIFMLPRETILAESYRHVMFRYKKCKYKDRYFFNPDVVLSSGNHYTSFWKDKTKTINIGYPKFDSYATKDWHDNAKDIKKRYNIDPKKKVIFFPAYWNEHYQSDGVDVFYADISEDFNKTMVALEKIAKENSDFQIIVKMHPISQKLLKKGKHTLDPVIKKYYNKKDGLIRVVKDTRYDGTIAKNILYISDLVVSFRSTMLLEAAFLNKPIINIMFDQCRGLKGLPDFINRVFSVHNEQDFHDAVINFETRKEEYKPTDDMVIKDYFHIIDGNFCKRFCDAVKSNI